MTEKSAIYIGRAGDVTATVYKCNGVFTHYRVALGLRSVTEPEFAPEQLEMVREALKQAELFLRYQEQLDRMIRCPGCGDG
jgi:hypothetical protein